MAAAVWVAGCYCVIDQVLCHAVKFFAVSPRFARLGVGTALLSKLMQGPFAGGAEQVASPGLANALMVVQVWVECHEKNTNANRFFVAHGFQLAGTRVSGKEIDKSSGDDVDVLNNVLMLKRGDSVMHTVC